MHDDLSPLTATSVRARKHGNWILWLYLFHKQRKQLFTLFMKQVQWACTATYDTYSESAWVANSFALAVYVDTYPLTAVSIRTSQVIVHLIFTQNEIKADIEIENK